MDAKVQRTDGAELKLVKLLEIEDEELLDVAEQIMQVVGIDFHTLDGRKRRKIFLELLALYKHPLDGSAYIEETYCDD